MVGAGVSTSAGLPDFRTPGTGLYDNLQKYDVPYPEAVFELDFFRENPDPFYLLCRELWPGQCPPTPAHFFLSLLHKKGMLQRCYSQNIDSLESVAGLPPSHLVAAHGNFDGATCVDTGRKVPVEEVRAAIMAGKEACTELNSKHGGLVKPDIVMFGEALPARFFELSSEDFAKSDLLIVMGTGLQVQPFASLIHRARPGVPRLLINRERAGEHSPLRLMGGGGFGFGPGFQFDEANMRDVFFQGDCDDGVKELVRLLGWEDEFASWCRTSSPAAS